MPEKSGFFDSTADDIRSYPARDFAEYFARMLTNGIYNGGTNLEVTAAGNDANVRLNLGYAWINGYVYSVYDSPIMLSIEPASTMDRIDRVILRLDTSIPIRAIRAIILQGAPNTSPTPPSLVRSGNIYDISLAQIRVKANSSIIQPSNITDERLNEAVCGLVNSLIRVDTATFQRQWDEFIAKVQNEGFATADYVNSRVTIGNINVGIMGLNNTYSLTLTPAVPALALGTTVRIKPNTSSAVGQTVYVSVSGLPAKKIVNSKAKDVRLLGGIVYTLVYDGVSAFILQGEGGEYGTATAADVLAPKTIGTDNGIVTGAMPNRSTENNHMPGLESTVLAGDRFLIKPPHGYFNGSTWVTAAVPGLTANNLRSGVNVAGLVGTLIEGKPFASGSATVQGPGRFTLDGGGNQDTAYIDVSGLAFVPKTIVVYYYLEVSTVYVAQTRTSGVVKNVWNVSYGNWFAQQFSGTSFMIPVSTKNTADVGRTIYWEAYG